MNIFYLDRNPSRCAKDHCDQHTVKMILEYAQMMSTAHRICDGDNDIMYKVAHKNHPSTIWTRDSYDNYMWLFDLFHHLLVEYTARYGKIHGTSKLYIPLSKAPSNIPRNGFTCPPLCMPDIYKQDDHVEAYRDFYRHDKAQFARWNYSDPPEWFESQYERTA